MRPALALVAALAVASAPSVSTGGSTTAAPSRLVDRTFSCSVGSTLGARILKVSARSGFRAPETPRKWKWLADAGLGGRDGSYVFVSAGAPPPPPLAANSPPWRWLQVELGRCSSSRVRVPLSPGGLTGGAADQIGSDRYECRAPSRVLVRVRALFQVATTLRRQRRYGKSWLTTATAAVAREASFAVRTPTGKPIAFAEVVESGKARLFTAPRCAPDR